MKVKGNHPLAEIISKRLFGINSVPNNERDKMVRRAIKAAVGYHKEALKEKPDCYFDEYYCGKWDESKK